MIRRAAGALRRRLIVDRGDYRRTVFLAGTGRSGTTWLEEMLNFRNDFRVMFEPFHSKKVDLLRNHGWNYRQYLRCSDRREKFLKPASAILNGNIRHRWVDQFNHNILPQKRLIKDIRAQLLLKWMNCHFPEMPIILLLRHPCAVAYSKLKLDWESRLSDFLAQDELLEDFIGPRQDAMAAACDSFEKHIFLWCVENYVPLSQFQDNKILIVFYENLCLSPAQEIARVFTFLGNDVPAGAVHCRGKPSALSRKHSAIVTGDSLINSWRNGISTSQIKRAVEICSLFGLQALYDDGDLPLTSGDQALSLLGN